MIIITQQEVTTDLKKQINDGFRRHALENTGYDEKLEAIAFVSHIDDKFAGAVIIGPFWGAPHIKNLYVDENFRGRGVGSVLMQQAFKYGREKDCLFAFVETMSFQAIEFYLKLGFQLEFSRAGYKCGTSFHYLKKML